MTRSVRIERHVLASNASSFDTAWRTFGWTPGIAGEVASRLEEQVPWATQAAASEQPARLAGEASQVLDPANLDRLDYAFQPIDGRLAFSVWGAIGEARSAAGEWRVATATLLFDAEAFEAIAGNPFALFESLVRKGDAWASLPQPAPIEPIDIEATADVRRTLDTARLREIERLRDALASRIGADALAERLAAVYEGIARVRRPPGPRHVAIRSTPDRMMPLVAKLAWLALPLTDRFRTSFTTEQRRAQRPRATVLVLTREWGEFVPEGALLVNGKAGAAAAPGRAFWARAVAAGGAASRLRSLERWALARGWSLLDRDDFSAVQASAEWSLAWHRDGASRALAERLVEIETSRDGSIPRFRAIGCVAAMAAARGDAATPGLGAMAAARGDAGTRRPRAIARWDTATPADDGEAGGPGDVDWILALAGRAGAGGMRVLRAAVRTLQRGSQESRRLAGAVRCASVARSVAPVSEMWRLFAEERAAAIGLVESAGERLGDGDPMRAAAGVAIQHDPSIVLPIVQLVSGTAGDQAARRFAAGVFQYAAAPAAAGSGADDAAIEVLLRLLWLQPDRGAALAERVLIAHRDTAPALLVRLMTAPAPMPTFLALRRLLLERVLPGAVFVQQTELHRLRSLSPALALHFAGTGDRLNA